MIKQLIHTVEEVNKQKQNYGGDDIVYKLKILRIFKPVAIQGYIGQIFIQPPNDNEHDDLVLLTNIYGHGLW